MIGIGGIIKIIKDTVGNLTDWVGVPYVFGVNSIMAHLNTMYWHIHGASFILPDEAPVTITSGGVGLVGAVTEVIGVGDIKHNFDIHWTSVSDISTTLQGMLYFYTRIDDADPWVLLVSACDVVRTTAQSREIQSPALIKQQPKGIAIGMAFKADAAAATVKVRLYGHVYANTLE
jgi:hypothetical protein